MKHLILFALAAALSLLGACHKNDPDPCIGAKPLSADFKAYGYPSFGWEDSNWNPRPYDTFNNSVLVIRAVDTTADEYHWEVGASKIEGKRVVSFYFSNDQYDISIPVRLVTKTHSSQYCPTRKNSADTIERTLYRSSKGFYTQLLGTYRGAYVYPTQDSVTFTFGWEVVEGDRSYLMLYGLTSRPYYLGSFDKAFGYRQMSFRDYDDDGVKTMRQPGPIGDSIYWNADKSIEMYLTWMTDSVKRTTEKRKIIAKFIKPWKN